MFADPYSEILNKSPGLPRGRGTTESKLLLCASCWARGALAAGGAAVGASMLVQRVMSLQNPVCPSASWRRQIKLAETETSVTSSSHLMAWK